MTANPRPITPVILSGGAGTRLWPLSTPERPKQMLALTARETMLQLTCLRTHGIEGFAAPLIVASGVQADAIDEQLEAIGVEPEKVILEPCGRNTAPAIAAAALAVDRETPLLIMPSDHLIADVEALRAAVAAARPLVDQGWLVTFGIEPDRPETGFGYIRRGDALGPRAFKAASFLEKPDLRLAEQMLAAGGHYWNAGIFFFTAGAFLDALAEHASDILANAGEAMERAAAEGRRLVPESESFARCASEAVDKAVMEKHSRIAVVPADIGWSDIGSWDALYEAALKDEALNAVQGRGVSVGSRGCLIRSDGPAVAVVGVEDLIVIASRDAVLVVPRGQSQSVRQAAAAVEREADAEASARMDPKQG